MRAPFPARSKPVKVTGMDIRVQAYGPQTVTSYRPTAVTSFRNAAGASAVSQDAATRGPVSPIAPIANYTAGNQANQAAAQEPAQTYTAGAQNGSSSQSGTVVDVYV